VAIVTAKRKVSLEHVNVSFHSTRSLIFVKVFPVHPLRFHKHDQKEFFRRCIFPTLCIYFLTLQVILTIHKQLSSAQLPTNNSSTVAGGGPEPSSTNQIREHHVVLITPSD
jgi:hypothetical protein